MKRLVIGLLIALSLPVVAVANDVMGMPWKPVSRAEDRRRVLEFFMFNCNYCMQADGMFVGWSKTLPREFSFEQVPVIASKDDIIGATAYYAVKYAEPYRLEAFKQALFRQMMGVGQASVSQEAISQAIDQAGVNQQRFVEMIDSQPVINSVQRAARMTAEYAVDMTPTIVVSGKYLFHAGYTGGNYELLVQLGNGLVSRELGGMR